MSKIVIIGGGTGSSILISALKNQGHDLFAIVPMGDSGGSTGRLREEFGVLSSGEIRQRLIAMASDDETARYLSELLNYRFEGGRELRGHNLGNILIAGFTEMYKSQAKALEILSKILKISGEIVPSTLEKFDLIAEYADGTKAISEHSIDEPEKDKRILSLATDPPVTANPRAIEVIKNADVIIFSMGDLYTSILHNVVVMGISEAISGSRAKKIYISNLFTSVGETTGMSLGDHVSEIEKYIRSNIDYILVNSKEISLDLINEYKKNGQSPVQQIITAEQSARLKVIKVDLLSDKEYKKDKTDVLTRSIMRHDPTKIYSALKNLI